MTWNQLLEKWVKKIEMPKPRTMRVCPVCKVHHSCDETSCRLCETWLRHHVVLGRVLKGEKRL